MAVIGPYCEISVIVMCLGRGSVVCLNNHVQRLHRLDVSVLFAIFCCLWRLRSRGPTFATKNFSRANLGASAEDVHVDQ